MGQNDDNEEAEVLPPSRPVPKAPRAAQIARAYRLRQKIRAHEVLTPEDVAWLAAFEQSTQVNAGRSASRKVSYTEEEASAEGVGNAAEAAAAATYAREEGRREDNLARIGIEALVRSNEDMRGVMALILQRNAALETVHLDMLSTVREQFVARTQAEVDLMRTQAEGEIEAAKQGDSIGAMAAELLPALLKGMQAKAKTESQGK